jgi:hypothetical protein
VLQLCRYPVIGWLDAPPGVFGLRSIQMASIRAGGHPHGSGMVFALLAFVPRRRGAIGRAWALGGSRHRLEMGPAVCPGTGAALAPAPQADERLVAGGRDVRPGQRQIGVLVPGGGLDRCDDRLPSLGQTRCQRRPSAFLTKALGGENHPAPRVINTDKHAAYPPAIVELKAGRVLEEKCTHRPVQYLNNVLEQDHRASNAGCVQATFSLLLGSLAHDRRLRSDSYDSQRARRTGVRRVRRSVYCTASLEASS